MKKLLTTLLVICLVFTTVFSLPVYAEGETEYLITNLAGKYKTQGRTVLNSDGVLLAHFPATGIEFNAYCSGDVSVTFTAYKPKEATTSDCYFTVIVDGETMPRDTIHITANGDATFKIAEGLAEGNHSFKIYRQNEIKFAYLGFKSITLNGEFLAPPEEKDMYIEYVGASQWGGAGNLGNKDTAFDTTEVQDATQGLTYLSAQILDADWSVVSMAGTGAYWGLELYPMNKLYNYYGYVHDNSTLYDFENSRKPDYVVIGLGTNDVSKAEKFGKTDEDIYDAFNYFIRLLRMKNPDAKIIWVHGMMNDQATPYVKKVVEDLGGAEYGVYELHVEKNNDGAAVHPSVEGHERMAEDVAAFIETLEEENASFTSEFVQKPYAPLSEGEVIMESDFNDVDGTNWQKFNNTNPQDKTLIAYMDDDKDGINDFVRLTSSDKGNLAILSAPFKLTPGKEYELSFWARIPEESNDFFTDTYKYYPKFALYKAPVSNGKVTDWYKEGTNDYVYNQGSFTNSVWTFGSELYEYVVKKYTVLSANNQYAAYANMDTDKIYDGWTRVTYKFTGFSADGSTTATDVAVSFALPKASTNSVGCMFDIKDVKMIEVGTNTGSDDNTGSEDTLTTTIMTSDFEKDVTASSWSTSTTSGTVQNMSDTTGDFVRLTAKKVDGSIKSAYVRSKTFALTPGNTYKLTYKIRVPSESVNFNTGSTYGLISPDVALYQIANGVVDQTVSTTTSLSDGNLYAQANEKYNRRSDLEFYWTVDGYKTITRKGYSDTGYLYNGTAIYQSVKNTDGTYPVLNEVFADWKEISLEFTATGAAEIAVLQFRMINAGENFMYDLKDVVLTETKSEEPETPETPEIVIPDTIPKYDPIPNAPTAPKGTIAISVSGGDNCHAFTTKTLAAEGEKVSVSASPKIGYKFIGWYEADELVTTEKHFTFNASVNRTLEARVELVTEENKEIAITPDVDFNGVADLNDVTNIAKDLAGWDLENINTARADVNGDGKTNLYDLVLAAQYAAGWDVQDKLASKEAYVLPEEDLAEEGLAEKVRAGESEYFNRSTILNEGNRALFVKLFEKAARGETITVASIGGSITQGVKDDKGQDRSFGKLVSEWFEEKFGIEVTNVNAGIGSTGSLMGVHRLQSDVLSYNPDLVILEYSVNDLSSKEGNFAYLETYEAIIRRVLEKDIALMTAVFGGTGKQYYTEYLSLHIHSALHYDLPVIDYYSSLFRYLDSGVIKWYDENDKQGGGITQDNLHPNLAGHVMISSAMNYYLEDVYAKYQAGEVYETAIDLPEETLFENTNLYNTATFYAGDNTLGYEVLTPLFNAGFDVGRVTGTSAKLGKGWVCSSGNGVIIFEFKNITSLLIPMMNCKTLSGKFSIEINGVTVRNNVSVDQANNATWPRFTRTFDKPLNVVIKITCHEGTVGVGPIGVTY